MACPHGFIVEIEPFGQRDDVPTKPKERPSELFSRRTRSADLSNWPAVLGYDDLLASAHRIQKRPAIGPELAHRNGYRRQVIAMKCHSAQANGTIPFCTCLYNIWRLVGKKSAYL